MDLAESLLGPDLLLRWLGCTNLHNRTGQRPDQLTVIASGLLISWAFSLAVKKDRMSCDSVGSQPPGDSPECSWSVATRGRETEAHTNCRHCSTRSRCRRLTLLSRRAMRQSGMQVFVNAIVALADARKSIFFNNTYCIKGYCSILVTPLRHREGIISWHLTTNKDGFHMLCTTHWPGQ